MVDTGFFEAWNVTDLGAIREALEQAVGFLVGRTYPSGLSRIMHRPTARG